MTDQPKSKRKPGPGKPFVKGQSGNPGGRPKALVNVTELARAQTEATIATLVEIRDGYVNSAGEQQVQAAARVAASKEILDRGWGRPPQFSTDKTREFRRAIDMSDDELASIATGDDQEPFTSGSSDNLSQGNQSKLH